MENRAYLGCWPGAYVEHEIKWIESTKELAGLLYEARKRFPSNQKFSDWLEENRIDLSHQERAALIKLAEHAEVANGVLEFTRRTSWELVWRKEVQPLVEPKKAKPVLRAARNTEPVVAPEIAPAIPAEPEIIEPEKKQLTGEKWAEKINAAYQPVLDAQEKAKRFLEGNGYLVINIEGDLELLDRIDAALKPDETSEAFVLEAIQHLLWEREREAAKSKRGRPKGSKNKPKTREEIQKVSEAAWDEMDRIRKEAAH
jgi:hypothetical protein